LQIGKVKFITKDDSEKDLCNKRGVVEVHTNKISMLAETIEAKEDIDVERAQTAKRLAEKHLETATGSEVDVYKTALSRAINRLKVAGVLE